MIRCVILEDEPSGQKLLESLLSKYFPQIKLLDVLERTDQAISWFQHNEVEIAFVDNHLKGGLAMEVISAIPPSSRPLCIFVSAHASFAIEALNSGASYYILKPVSEEDFLKAMHKVMLQLPDSIHKSMLPDTSELSFAANQIVYIESSGPYSTFFLTNMTQVVYSKNMGYYQSLLDADQFCRIHHSFLINLALIKKVKRNPKTEVLMEGWERPLPVSQRKAADFFAAYKHFTENSNSM